MNRAEATRTVEYVDTTVPTAPDTTPTLDDEPTEIGGYVLGGSVTVVLDDGTEATICPVEFEE